MWFIFSLHLVNFFQHNNTHLSLWWFCRLNFAKRCGGAAAKEWIDGALACAGRKSARNNKTWKMGPLHHRNTNSSTLLAASGAAESKSTPPHPTCATGAAGRSVGHFGYFCRSAKINFLAPRAKTPIQLGWRIYRRARSIYFLFTRPHISHAHMRVHCHITSNSKIFISYIIFFF